MARVLAADAERLPVEENGSRRNVLIHRGDDPVGHVVVEEQGTIEKANQSRLAYGQAELTLADELAVETCQFDFNALSRQVRNECVRP
ncbi:hypothetical protein, partial [Rhodovulum sulfidophilum]|uniref:hypothetical protein n=1 Tax=Rhodovulum sulfidophilum TaxID=35806 RepID=UPI001F356886